MATVEEIVARLIAAGTPPGVAAAAITEAFAAGAALIGDLVKARVDPPLIDRVSNALAMPPVFSLRAEYGTGPHSVYGIKDLRNNAIFYVGITANSVEYRVYSHSTDPMSSAWARIREIKQTGHDIGIHIFDEFSSRQDALDLEFSLIQTLPNLVNRDRRRQHARGMQ